MRYPTRRWTSFPGVLVHWVEMSSLALVYVLGRRLLGLDHLIDWKQWGLLVLLSTFVLTMVFIYGRPLPQERDSTRT